jgi:L-ascorbate metabolism protein UlaG (beta-lactamase superfamily)
MRMAYYANACCKMEAAGFSILTDPWLVDGAFEESWCHYPPLATRPEDVAGVDALFISHVHPDHCDPATLAAFRRDIPIIVLDHGPNFLHRVLREMGFTDLRPIATGAKDRIGPFEVTLYAPFTTHIFHESRIGNLIDCAALFEHDGVSILNLNDNTPDLASAQRLRDRHGRVTVAQIAYNAAGPYPASFDNLTAEQKVAASDKILARNLAHAAELARILEPAWHMPFAGSYVLGGGHWRRNACLGATSTDVAAQARPSTCGPDGRIEADRPQVEPRITVGMNPKLLRRVLTGAAHWNNAENGCHFTYLREPDVYVRDFHTLMSFFAADPADVAAADAEAALKRVSQRPTRFRSRTFPRIPRPSSGLPSPAERSRPAPGTPGRPRPCSNAWRRGRMSTDHG